MTDEENLVFEQMRFDFAKSVIMMTSKMQV